MKRIIALIVVTCFFTFGMPHSISANNDAVGTSTPENIFTDEFVENEVLIKAESFAQANTYAQAYGGQLKSYSEYGFAVLTIPDAKNAVGSIRSARSYLPPLSFNHIYETAMVKDAIPEGYIKDASQQDIWVPADGDKQKPMIVSVPADNQEPISNIVLSGNTDDPDFSKQYFHDEMDNMKAWDITKGSSDVVVAVIDTGIDIDHPELKDSILEQSYNSHTNEIGISKVKDDKGHGTHVSGIIAAAQNNSFGGSGVAPNVKIMAIKANIPNNPNYFESVSVIRGIYYAADNGADIINLSLGRSYASGENTIEKEAIAYAVSKGVTVVCAAGNSNQDHAAYPAAYEDCIAVSATRSEYNIDLSYTCYGPEIDIAAPGTFIYSTVPDGYTYYTGTSMASPNVAGVAALIKSVNPDFTVAQVKERLYSTAKDICAVGRDDFSGYGIVNSYNALLGPESLIPVTYKQNDGQSINDVTTAVSSGSKLCQVYPKTRVGYTFKGWFNEPECETPFDYMSTTISSPITLYAKWADSSAVTDSSEFNYTIENGYIKIMNYIGYSDTIVIPEHIEEAEVRTLGAFSFNDKVFIRKVIIPNTVTTICDKAFLNCVNLETIVIPDSVIDMRLGPFDNTKWYRNQPDGMIYAGKVAYNYKGVIPNHIKITLEAGTVGIASLAFATRRYPPAYNFIASGNNLAEVVIPDSVIYISKEAFLACEKMKTITIPGSVKTIDDNAFNYCYMMESITISDGVLNFGTDVFSACRALRTLSIPKSVKSIGYKIGSSAYALENIYVDEQNPYYTHVDGVLYSNDKTQLIQYPLGKSDITYELQPQVSYVNPYSFMNNANLNRILLNDGLKIIGSDAFSDCRKLESIYIPESVQTIGPDAFSGCDALESAYFMGNAPNMSYTFVKKDLTPLPNLTIYYIQGKTGFTTPIWRPINGNISYQTQLFDGVLPSFVSPSQYLFKKNQETQGDLSIFLYSSIYDFDSITLNGIQLTENIDFTVSGRMHTIKKEAMSQLEAGEYSCVFTLCGGSTCVLTLTVTQTEYAPESEFEFAAGTGTITKYKGQRQQVIIPPQINNVTVRRINDYAFDSNETLKDVVMPETLETIGVGAFNRCMALESIHIPNGVTTIDVLAFANCISVESIDLPASLTNISIMAFGGSKALREINVDPLNINYASYDNVLYCNISNTLMLYPALKTDLSYSVREGTKTIDVQAFANCKYIESITLPDDVITISSLAFVNCSLKSIHLSNNLKNIGLMAFSLCMNLDELTLPASVSTIGSKAFEQSMLKAIYVDSANTCYTSIDGVLYDKAVRTLLQYPIARSNSFYVIPEGVTEIAANATIGCNFLSRILIPASLNNISESAFSSCEMLQTIVFNGDIASIGKNAFSNCNNLNEVRVFGNAPSTVGTDIFSGASADLAIYYMEGKSGWVTPTWNDINTFIMSEEVIIYLNQCTITNQGDTTTVKLDFSLLNSTNIEQGLVSVAIYDDNGMLLHILYLKNINQIKTGENIFTVNELSKIPKLGKYLLKINVWDNDETIRPLSNQFSTIIQ